MDTSDYNLLQETARCRYLLEGYFEGTLTGAERSELAAWLWEERHNRDLLRRLKESTGLYEYHLRRQQIDPAAEYKTLVKRLPQARSRRRRSWVAAAVAAAVLVFGVTGMWMLTDRGPTELPHGALLTSAALSHPKATLHTSGGEIFEFDGSKSIRDNDRFVYTDSLQQLVYNDSPVPESQTVFAQLFVPQGGEFKMTLPDGTNVWLNSESSIRFPETFPADRREVFVRGEVYFEVTGDASRPFIVDASGMKTEVLGTHFGISAYDDEPVWSTVLAEGSVRVSYRGESIMLTPNNKAVMEGGTLVEKTADLSHDLAWINREFVFESDRLEDVVRRLERWYPVKFRFTDEGLRDYHFTGSVGRDMEIGEILSLIEMMNVVAFSTDGEHIDIIRNENR